VAAFIEADFTDSSLPFFDQASMPAGVAAQSICGQILGELGRAFGSHLVQYCG
jgi:hypothetical protein